MNDSHHARLVFFAQSKLEINNCNFYVYLFYTLALDLDNQRQRHKNGVSSLLGFENFHFHF